MLKHSVSGIFLFNERNDAGSQELLRKNNHRLVKKRGGVKV